MKALLRIAAASSFVFFLAGGCLLLGIAGQAARDGGEALLLVPVGLFFIGTAFFVGSILLVAAERFGRKNESK
jgi:uncharacterized membrane protein YgdD (TMEM256/DUF423 family)